MNCRIAENYDYDEIMMFEGSIKTTHIIQREIFALLKCYSYGWYPQIFTLTFTFSVVMKGFQGDWIPTISMSTHEPQVYELNNTFHSFMKSMWFEFIEDSPFHCQL